MTIEIWKNVPSFPKYAASDQGRIMGPRGKILAPVTTQYGYHQITVLDHNGKRYTRFIHRLVADAWIGPPPTPEHDIAHNDGSRTNNRPDNLRWALPVENDKDKDRHGTRQRGSKSGMAKINETIARDIRFLFDLGRDQKEIAEIYGIHRRTVNSIVRKVTWTHV